MSTCSCHLFSNSTRSAQCGAAAAQADVRGECGGGDEAGAAGRV